MQQTVTCSPACESHSSLLLRCSLLEKAEKRKRKKEHSKEAEKRHKLEAKNHLPTDGSFLEQFLKGAIGAVEGKEASAAAAGSAAANSTAAAAAAAAPAEPASAASSSDATASAAAAESPSATTISADPQVVDVASMRVGSVSVKLRSMGEIRDVMRPAIEELYAALKAQGVTATGPLTSYYPQGITDGTAFELRVCAPIPAEASVTPLGRFSPSEIPSGRVARLDYTGPLEGLSDAWARLTAWIKGESQLSAMRGLYETYSKGFAETKDTEKHVTQLNRFVALQQ
jgi:effector-binding domain-containing protein